VWSYGYKDGPSAVALAERFSNGEATLEEFERTQASMAPYLQLSDGAPAKTAAATTHQIAGLGAKIAAASAASAIAHYGGLRAKLAVRRSRDEFENYCKRNAAYDSGSFKALKAAKRAQEERFVQLLSAVDSEAFCHTGASVLPPSKLRGAHLQFPESIYCGKLTLFETNNPDVYENYQEHDAQGTIDVPAGWSASLLVDKSLRNFSYLAKCDPFFILDEIDLRWAVICDDDLQYFSCLRSLRKLNFRSAQITGEGLKQLHSLSSLIFLELMYSSVTDAAIRHIQSLTTLKYLNLGHTAITNEGLRHLQSLIQLEELYLWGTNISDIGLRYLQPLTRLRKLSLHRTRISDDGIGFIKIHSGLNSINLEDTKVSEEGKQRLRVMLPECSIS